jgi:hypothetical protein
MVKVKEDITGWIMSEHGVPESRLIVIKQVEDYIKPNGKREAQYLCECNCNEHNAIIIRASYIKTGHTLSCGCLQKENTSKSHKKYNNYNLSGEYGIGYCSNTGSEFYFDLEDYDKIKNYCWHEHIDNKTHYHYLQAYDTNTKKLILFHHLFDCKGWDHINRNPLDNRKSNLRPATYQENAYNTGVRSNNTSGIIGVYKHDTGDKWRARIKVGDKQIDLGLFSNKEDAIKARLEAEFMYCKEFAPQQHLYEKYGINYEG